MSRLTGHRSGESPDAEGDGNDTAQAVSFVVIKWLVQDGTGYLLKTRAGLLFKPTRERTLRRSAGRRNARKAIGRMHNSTLQGETLAVKCGQTLRLALDQHILCVAYIRR